MTAQIAILDDISRAPGEALNVILRILNVRLPRRPVSLILTLGQERKFGGERIPLLTAIATGNPCQEVLRAPAEPMHFFQY